MLTIVIRTLIILFFLILGVRLMGKRTIGELQPYEFVITLAVADLACVPMQDISVPISYGLIPLIALFIVHYVMTAIISKSIKFRKFVNGKPMVVIDNDGINSECLTKLNMDVNDLISLIRQQGYFSIPEISYGILETNGKLSIMENENATPPQSVPMTLIVEGKFMSENLSSLCIEKKDVEECLKEKRIKTKDVVLMTADSGNWFIQPRNDKYFTLPERKGA